MDIFDFYRDENKHSELATLLTHGSQQHPTGLDQSFLEKDIWVTEILRLIYNEGLCDGFSVAFKGGTALSKCWKAIERFSEDIDLSIHWSELANAEDESQAWQDTTVTGAQNKKFRVRQQERLEDWTTKFNDRLNILLSEYGISGLYAELDPDSKGEKVYVHFPRVTSSNNTFQLDQILLEFGGRNRGRPTDEINIECYLSDIADLAEQLSLPKARVKAFQPSYIVWEKLTALHQYSTQKKDPDPYRLSRHWYDTDCLIQKNIVDPKATIEAMNNVIEMKSMRWRQKDVNYDSIKQGNLCLVPEGKRYDDIAKDYKQTVDGRMFFQEPDSFEVIAERLLEIQTSINDHLKQATD